MILCTICARAGSKGVLNKNIRCLLGRPLIVYTIEQAKKHHRINAVVVSTDSKTIATVARQCGVSVLMRPKHLALDTTPKIPVIQHAVQWWMAQHNQKPDYVIDMDPTSPLRNDADIRKCLNALIKDKGVDSVVTGYRSNKNPYFNMLETNKRGYAVISKKFKKSIACRQQAPVVYAMNASIYAWKTDILFKRKSATKGKIKLVEMPEERSVDIDSELDFKLVQYLMKEKNSHGIS